MIGPIRLRFTIRTGGWAGQWPVAFGLAALALIVYDLSRAWGVLRAPSAHVFIFFCF